MKHIIFLILTTAAMNIHAQELKKANFEGTWELDWIHSGFFPNDDLIFKKSDSSGGQYIFSFEKDGILSQKLGAEGLGECPVGFFTLEKGTWQFAEDAMTLNLKGEKIADYFYDYTIVYSPKLDGELLKLTVITIVKSEENK
ncbi:MAG: hypothetical protein AB8B59_11275 [Maribacter sp.]